MYVDETNDVEAISQLTNGNGVDYVFETSGFHQSLRMWRSLFSDLSNFPISVIIYIGSSLVYKLEVKTLTPCIIPRRLFLFQISIKKSLRR
jgi:threonine dehydrogenase-like Zn-dependent dehydrogenase